jgi:hypothetical protein
MVDISQQPEMVPKPSSPHLSTYRLISSSPGYSTVFALVFPISSSLMSRVRGDVVALGLRAQATEVTSLSSIHDCDEDPNLRLLEHQLYSLPEPLQPQPMLPLRVPLMRLSDPVPILQDSRVFHASSPSDDGPLLTYSSLPPTPIPSSPPPSTSNAERYRLPQK